MVKRLIAVVLAILAGTLAFSQQKAPPQRAAIPRRVLQDAVLGFYISEFQKQAEVSPEVFGKILPFLQQFVQDRFEISQRRTRALNQLRQAVQRGASEDDLKRLVHDFDSADADFQANQEKFLTNVDPLLEPKQQAKLRIFQVMADNRMRQMLMTVQNPNRGQ
jgi:hypothetical protein